MAKIVNNGLLDTLATELQDVDSCVLVGFHGMTVFETVALRGRLRAQNFHMRVVRNNLASLAFERTALKGLGARLDGPSAVIYGGEGAIAISKLVVAEVRTNKKLKIHGGFAEGEVLDAGGINALSQVPSRQDLLAMTMGAFFGPVSEFARSLDGLLGEVHGLIEALEKKQAPEASGG